VHVDEDRLRTGGQDRRDGPRQEGCGADLRGAAGESLVHEAGSDAVRIPSGIDETTGFFAWGYFVAMFWP
jgi:hypothetical protein